MSATPSSSAGEAARPTPRSSLARRLLASYVVVIAVVAVSAFAAGEALAPFFLERHLQQMTALDPTAPHDAAMAADLAAQYRRALTQSLAWSAIAATLAAIGVAAFVTKRIVAPLRAMQRASHRIAGGRYDRRLDAGAPGEIGELAQSFNTIAAALGESEDRRHQLVSDLAHEIRTPLSNLRGYLEGIEDGVFAPDAETTWAFSRQVDRLERLVEDLGLLSRLAEGAVSIRPTVAPAWELAGASVASFRARFEEKGVALTVKDFPRSLRVRADTARCAQVLENLLGNALRHTPGGGSVEVDARGEGTQVRFEVRDTGPGVPEGLREAIFRRFVRADPARMVEHGGGSGLGLTIAKELVDRHGGDIGVEVRDGGGSTFWFTLPAG